MTQKQIDSRLRDLQPFLARAKASGDTAGEDRVLKEIYFLEDHVDGASNGKVAHPVT